MGGPHAVLHLTIVLSAVRVAHSQLGKPLLLLAVRKGHKAIAAALIEAGAYVNEHDGVGAVQLVALR